MIKKLLEQLMQDIKPDWEFWRDKRTATIQEAVLLSLDICPYKAKEIGDPILNEDTKNLFAKRLKIIADWMPTFEFVDNWGVSKSLNHREIHDFYRFVDWMVNERKWTGLPVHMHDIAAQYQASLPPPFDFANPNGTPVKAESQRPIRPWIPRAQELGVEYCRSYIGSVNPQFCTKRQTAKHVAQILEKEGYRTKGGDGLIDYQTVEREAFKEGWWDKNNPALKIIPRDNDRASR